MRENSVKRMWRDGEVTFGGWLSIPSGFSAEVMAHQGFDWLCIDMQHGVIDYQSAVGMLQAISTTETIPFVRVPWNEPGIIGKMLDAGAYGVIVPMVNSPAEAEAAIAACRYAPDGSRSYGPIRAAYYGGADYAQHANQEIACIPMIETKTAVAQLDEILAVPGIDAVYVGPADLSLTLGLPPRMDHDDESFQDARRAIAEGCKKRGIIAGIHASARLAPKHIEAGYRMITISSDIGALAGGAAQDLRSLRKTDASGQPVYQ
ncbi:MAG: 2,4-dihydroxyhept-2-ene-1,7-dioic acid aldolase [Chloroflexi bacterium]|nr:2,4-dihydroxyhept-2-ene-1,7-dioic acid aldolase [Chloroflexota bacterium]